MEVADSSLGLDLDPLRELFERFSSFCHPSVLPEPFYLEIGTCKAYLPCNSFVFACVSFVLDQDIFSSSCFSRAEIFLIFNDFETPPDPLRPPLQPPASPRIHPSDRPNPCQNDDFLDILMIFDDFCSF